MGGYVQIFKMVRRSSIACIVDVESCKCLVEDCMLLMHELFFESIVTQMMSARGISFVSKERDQNRSLAVMVQETVAEIIAYIQSIQVRQPKSQQKIRQVQDWAIHIIDFN